MENNEDEEVTMVLGCWSDDLDWSFYNLHGEVGSLSRMVKEKSKLDGSGTEQSWIADFIEARLSASKDNDEAGRFMHGGR